MLKYDYSKRYALAEHSICGNSNRLRIGCGSDTKFMHGYFVGSTLGFRVVIGSK